MGWRLWLDDIRDPPPGDWTVCRGSMEAIGYVRRLGMPEAMSLDHDLGGDDTGMRFLRNLAGLRCPRPVATVHSQNPVGAERMRAFIADWPVER
jgi:hypothetical protein